LSICGVGSTRFVCMSIMSWIMVFFKRGNEVLIYHCMAF